MITKAQIELWAKARTESHEALLYRIDAEHAAIVGLPVFAALAEFADEMRRVPGWLSGREVVEKLRPAIQVALGEGQERLKFALRDATIELPGGTMPLVLLERDHKMFP